MGVLAVIAVVLIALTWFVWPTRTQTGSGRRERPDIDEAELEAAERDVQEAPDAETVRDWGPGAGQKPLP